MLKGIQFSLILLLFLTACGISARAEELLTWEDCLKETAQNHPNLISAAESLNQAKASKAVNASGLLPEVTAELSEQTAQSATSNQSDTYAYSISGRQLIFDGLQTWHNINAASESVRSSEFNYAVTSSNVRLSLREAFVALLKAQELLGITADIAARRKQNVELVTLRYEAGREHKGSLLNEEANFAQAEFELAQAKRNINLVQRQLTNELGRKQLTPIKVNGDFEIKQASSERPDFEYLTDNNPFLLELISQKEAAGFNLKYAQADFFPKVYANASIGRTDTGWPPHNEQWSAGLTLSLPIFEGGSRWAELSKARAALKSAQAEERSGRDLVIFTLEKTWKEWQDALDQISVEQKFLAAAEERAKITQAQYGIGLISFDDWSIIEDNLVNAKKAYLNTKAEALVKEAYWIQAKGGTLGYGEE